MTNIDQQLEEFHRHHFFNKMEWILSRVSPPFNANIKYPKRDNVDYPTIESDYSNIEPEIMKIFEAAQNIYNFASIIIGTLDKIELSVNNIEGLTFGKNIEKSTRLLEYHIENYYLRLPIVLEQLYALLSELLVLDYDFRKPIRDFEALLKINVPDLWEAIDSYKQETKQIKQMRNIVAHVGNYEEDDLNKLRSWLNLNISYGSLVPLDEHKSNSEYMETMNNHLAPHLEKYRDVFLSKAVSQTQNLIAFLDKVFTKIETIASERFLK